MLTTTVRVLHTEQSAPRCPPSAPRARANVRTRSPLQDDEDARVAKAIFRAACAAAGLSLSQVARSANVDASIIERKTREGCAEIVNLKDILRAPMSVRREIAKLLTDDERPLGLAPEVLVRRLFAEVGDIARVLDEGLVGGALDDAALARVEREAVEAERAASAMVREVRSLRARRAEAR